MNNSKSLTLLAIAISLEPSAAFAYVDPGSGSVIVTTILGFFAAIAYTFRKYFYKLKRAIFGGKDVEEQSRSLDD
ncbi:MAG: hypothetical protein AAGF53_08460 [Pseudomonadota bacterium]